MRKAIKRVCQGVFVLIFLSVLAAVITVTFTAVKGWQMYRRALEEKPITKVVAEIQQDAGYTELETLPDIYVRAVLTVEDRRFYQHGGIDPIAIGRAVLHDLKAGRLEQGGSTITQQLAKNLFFSQEKSFVRKAAEVFMSFDLERKYSKDEILELYLNSIYFGSGCYGVREASHAYFEKEPEDLNDWEATLLAGIPNAPTAYSFKTAPELARQRQLQVLNQMEDAGVLNGDEAAAILAQEEEGGKAA